MPIQSKQQPPYYTPGELNTFKTLIALVSQATTGAPILTIIKNTYNTINTNRDSAGTYAITSTDEFTLNKTYYSITNNIGLPNEFVLSYGTIAQIDLYTLVSGTPTDTLLFDTPIQIITYV